MSPFWVCHRRVTVEIGWRPVIAVTATLVATHMELSHGAKDLALVGKMVCSHFEFLFLPSWGVWCLMRVCFLWRSRSAERPTGDLRERMKNKRQDVDAENLKRDEPTSPTARVSYEILAPFEIKNLLKKACAEMLVEHKKKWKCLYMFLCSRETPPEADTGRRRTSRSQRSAPQPVKKSPQSGKPIVKVW